MPGQTKESLPHKSWPHRLQVGLFFLVVGILFAGILLSLWSRSDLASSSFAALAFVGLAVTALFLWWTLYSLSELKGSEKTHTLLDIQQHEVQDKLQRQSQQIEQERAKLEATLNSIGDGVIATSKDGNIFLVNDQAGLALGRPAHTLFGKILAQDIPAFTHDGQAIPNQERPVTKTLTQGIKTTQVVYYERTDGTRFPASVTLSPIVMNDQIIGAVQTFRDITREKEIDEVKTEFISLVSHQLRTPISAIKWFGDMLLAGDAGELNAEQKDFVTNICKTNERMIQLVNTILNISRIESGRIIIDPKPTDLKLLYQAVIDELRTKAQSKGVTIDFHTEDNLPIIKTDPTLTSEVFTNLLANAIKYTTKSGTVTIDVYSENGGVVTKVQDTGYGIAQVDQHKVFQKFFRGKNITSLVTEGTGLGLYLVKKIIDSSKGEIWFESTEGQGTTFWFRLPIEGPPPREGVVSLVSTTSLS